MDRTERLLDLLALLLDAKHPVSWAQLREAFPRDYGSGSDDACERKFERDKAELLEVGIPLRFLQGDDDRPEGYVLDREAYYLPPVTFSPEELAVLYTAGVAALDSGAFPGRRELAHALRKVGYLAPGEPPRVSVRMELDSPGGSARVAGLLETLWEAVSARKRVTLRYRSPRQQAITERAVDPYGLALHDGVWSLVGHCQLRGGLRTFLVHRIEDLSVNTRQPRTPDFELPKDFELDAHVARHAWRLPDHAPLEVHLRLSAQLLPLAHHHWPDARLEPDGLVAITCTSLDGLLRTVLPRGRAARVVAPARAVERMRELLERTAAAHEAPVERAARAAGGGR